MEIVKKSAGRISPMLMGEYDNTTAYRRLDWVYYGGTSYICKKNDTIGISPVDANRWQKIIEIPTELNMNFDDITERENINSGDKLSVILGKIKKYFSDLKIVAFSGKYADLEGKLTLTNSLLATAPGTALDAVQGTALKEPLDAVTKCITMTNPNPEKLLEKIIETFPGKSCLTNIAIYTQDGELGVPNGYYIGTLTYNGGCANGILLNNENALQRFSVRARWFEGKYIMIKPFTDVEDLPGKISQINSDLDFGSKWLPSNGFDLFGDTTSAIKMYSTNPNLVPQQGLPSSLSEYGTVVIFLKQGYKFAIYVDVFNKMAVLVKDKEWKNYDPDILQNKLDKTGILSQTCIPWEDINITGSNRCVIFFSNWSGASAFPENYGSGIVLPCIDISNRKILYIGNSGKLYSGTFKSNDKNSITWSS